MEHVFRSLAILSILFIIPFFNSCDKAESSILEQSSLVATPVSEPDATEKRSSAALNGNRIYFSSDLMTVTHAEFELINERILHDGFSVAEGCNYIGSEEAEGQAQWENAVEESYELISWGKNTTTFRYVDLPFVFYSCSETPSPEESPYCYYLSDNSDIYLNIFIGDNVYDCLLGSFTVYGSTTYATIDLQPLTLPLYGQGCTPICIGN